MASATKIIQWTKTDWFGKQPDISEERFMVASGKDAILCTSGLAICFAVCARGKTKAGVPVLAMAHAVDNVLVIKNVQFLKRELMRKGCLPETIDSFVVGGGRYPEASSENGEKLVAQKTKEERILESALNLTQGEEDDPVNVVFTADKLYLSKEPLFESTNDDAGDSIYLGIEAEGEAAKSGKKDIVADKKDGS